jgi:hypothetical protein
MSNPIAHAAEVVGHDLKIAVVDTGHAIIKTVEFLPHAVKLLDTAIQDQPKVKEAVIDLIKQAGVVTGDVTIDVTDKGVNLVADLQTLKDIVAFFNYFKSTWVPLIEQLYGEVKADLAN